MNFRQDFHGRVAGLIATAGLGFFTGIAIFFAPAMRAAEATNTTVSILVVEQGDNRPTYVEFFSLLRQVLTTNLSRHVVIYRENLDLTRFGGNNYRADLKDWLRKKYQGHKLDAIVASGETSIDFILKARAQLWPETPVVVIGTRGMEATLLAGHTNVTGVTVDINVPGTLAAALQLYPDTRRIAFVASAQNELPEFHRQDLKQVETFATNRFELIKLVGLTMPETRQRLATLPPDTIVFYDDIWVDGAGEIFIPRVALEELSAVSRAPIFSYSDNYIGSGMAGGACLSYPTLGREVANQLAAVIRAGNANGVPVLRSSSSQLVFDWRQLQKYGLNERQIPPDSRVRFRTPTTWATHHLAILLVSAALLVQTASIATLLVQRRRRRQVETMRLAQNHVLEMIATGAPLKNTLDCLARLIESQSDGLLCSVVLLDEDGRHMRSCAAPSLPEAFAQSLDGAVIGPKAGSCGTAMYRKEPVYVTDILTDPLWEDIRQLAAPHQLRACWSTPILLHQKDDEKRVLGSFAFYFQKSRSPRPAHRRLFDIATHIAGIAIERKRAEDALFQSRQMLRTVLDTIPQRVFWKDRNSVYLGCNKSFSLDCGCADASAMIGKTDEDTSSAAMAAHYRADDREVMETNRPKLNYEEPQIRTDGTRSWLRTNKVPLHDQYGLVTGVLGTYEDITERKQINQAVRESEQRLRTLAEASFEGICISENGRILDVNDQFTVMFGYARGELIGREIITLAAPESCATVAEAIRTDRETPYEHQLLRKDGTIFHGEAQAKTNFLKNRKVRVTAVRDLTERKQLEEQLRQSQKMEAFGQLAGGVAHDFNNLLTVIQGNAALLQMDAAIDREQAACLDEIAKASERAANLTRQLLTFSRRQIFQPKPLDLNEIVADTTKMLHRLIGEHIRLETHYAKGGALVMADPNMMEQILVNLAVNSRDAMPKGGRLIIQTASVLVSEANARSNPKARPGAFIRLNVSDTGCGIESGNLQQIFEPFFTTKEIGKGTGLGLATVFGIVAQHNGWIDVKSKVNTGTTFQIYLPELTENTQGDAVPPQSSKIRGGHETILLVEDETPVRSLAKLVLERQGYQIIEADSGVSATELWQQHHHSIDLLLTDMVMPKGMSGHELAERLRAQKPGLKVIYCSGYSDEMLGENSPLRRNPNFMEKPFAPQKLLQQVRDCLDGVTGS